MTKLTPLQHFFRCFSYSQAIVAAVMILAGLWFRLTTGWHAASFIFFVWGLCCVYMSIACLYGWRNWFLDGNPDPVLEKKRRKSMVIYIVLGGVVWAFFGVVVIAAAFDRVHIDEFDIKRTPQFDRELQRFISVAKDGGYDPVKEYTDSRLIIQGYSAGATSVLWMLDRYYNRITKDSHIHIISVGKEKYRLILLSHKLHYGWLDYETGGQPGNQYITKFCQLFVPFTVETIEGEAISNRTLDGVRPTFVELPKLNTLDIALVKGELVVSNFIPQGAGAESCRSGALEYTTTNRRTPLGSMSLDSAPIYLIRYLAFPGFNDAVLGRSSYRARVLNKDFSKYIRRVDRVSRSIFN